MEKTTHRKLSCGIELGCVELPDRHAVAIEFRILGGTVHEPVDRLGITHLIQETIVLGTEKHDGRGLSDAFDEIGASHGGWVGREATGYHCLALPEFLDRVIELHAELLRTPTFPADAVEVAVELAQQEITALDDDAHGLSDKLLDAQVYGPILGRHSLGEPETIAGTTRDHLVEHWMKLYHGGRMQVFAAGAVETQQLADMLEKRFEGFGSVEPCGREHVKVAFEPKHRHFTKSLEQQQIGIAFPGVSITDDHFAVQRVMLGVLSGGMSARLFTEVREKLGLVYWVSAWAESPRGMGMIFLGASSTPDRCHTTYETLLKEVDRLGDDLTQEELSRAAAGIVANLKTRGDTTRARCSELAEDLFHYGHPLPWEEKTRRIQAVTIDDIKQFLLDHPRDRLSVLTLGPNVLEGGEIAGSFDSKGSNS